MLFKGFHTKRKTIDCPVCGEKPSFERGRHMWSIEGCEHLVVRMASSDMAEFEIEDKLKKNSSWDIQGVSCGGWPVAR